MERESKDFQDPDLKAALQRLRGGHRAPAELVACVRRQLEEEAARPARRPSRRIWLWRGGIAACLALGIGTAAFLKIRHDRHEQEEYLEANRPLFSEMAAIADRAMTPEEMRPGWVAGDPAAAPAKGSQELGRWIPSASVTGWTLGRAGVCRFGAGVAGRFELSRGADGMTLFSLPISVAQHAEDGEAYEITIGDRAIAGFISRGGLHCVVGGHGMSLAEVVSVRDKLRKL
jgi:hypothetical protein